MKTTLDVIFEKNALITLLYVCASLVNFRNTSALSARKIKTQHREMHFRYFQFLRASIQIINIDKKKKNRIYRTVFSKINCPATKISIFDIPSARFQNTNKHSSPGSYILPVYRTSCVFCRKQAIPEEFSLRPRARECNRVESPASYSSIKYHSLSLSCSRSRSRVITAVCKSDCANIARRL